MQCLYQILLQLFINDGAHTHSLQDVGATKLCSCAAEVRKAVFSQAVTSKVYTEKRSIDSCTTQM